MGDQVAKRGDVDKPPKDAQAALAALVANSAGSEFQVAETYAYFGEPVYIYSLKEGINDGFLTPFRVKQISTTMDEYTYTPDDTLVEGEIEAGKRYTEPNFNKIIEIKEREKKLAAESGKESREKDKWRAYSHFLSLFCRNYCCI